MENPDFPHRARPKKPAIPPSTDVVVTLANGPVGRRTARAQDFWHFQGVRLREVLSDLFDVFESRIELHAPIDEDARFDMALVPPIEVDQDTMQRLMEAGIAKHFGVEIVRESRHADVYVLTAPNGITAPVTAFGGGLGAFSFDVTETEVTADFPGADASPDEVARQFEAHRARFEQRMRAFTGGAPRGHRRAGRVDVSGTTTLTFLCLMLEGQLDRLVVDETGVDGSFELALQTDEGTDGLMRALKDRLGLELSPEPRDIEMIVVRPIA